MYERHPRFERCRLRHQREIVRLLHRTRAEQGEARGADRHHVRMVAEDRQSLCGDGSGGNMQDASSPAILNMFGIISSRPCEAVKVVVKAPAWSAPCTAPAAPLSACISWTNGTAPHRFFTPCADQSSASSAIPEDGV